jgi:hypothetical protein
MFNQLNRRVRKVISNFSEQQTKSSEDIIKTLKWIDKSLDEIKKAFVQTDLEELKEGISKEQFDYLLSLQ